ncbi:uncharacterized protein [Rutidosis leptorrhynchoides]|uniref:uncharacterized protein n=1 Tax=Rutidosis leptorrhynchoides TaxID=125765 RepID=UPI003A997BAA
MGLEPGPEMVLYTDPITRPVYPKKDSESIYSARKPDNMARKHYNSSIYPITRPVYLWETRLPDSSDSSNVTFVWDWLRPSRGRTASELVELQQILHSIDFDFSASSKWTWSLANNGIFTVKRLACILDQQVLGGSSINPQQTLSNNLIPKKVEIFVWKTRKKRLPVRVELDKLFAMMGLHSIRCPVCDDGLESVDHLFTSCKFSKDVWSRIFKWWNLNISQSVAFSDLFLGKSSSNMSTLGSKIWQVVEWVVAYYIWKNRNLVVFQNKGWISPVVVSAIQVKSFE